MKKHGIIRTIFILICTTALLFPLTGCTWFMSQEERQELYDQRAYEDYMNINDVTPLLNTIDEFFQVETGMSKDDVLDVLNKNDDYLNNGKDETSDGGMIRYTIDFDSYKADVPYHVEISYGFYSNRVNRMNYSISKSESANNALLNMKGLLSKDEVVKRIKSHIHGASDKSDNPSKRSFYDLYLSKSDDKWRLMMSSGSDDNSISIIDDTFYKPEPTKPKKENTSDGKVGDNNGDGKVDEEDWEQEWKDYINKKMNEN